VYYNGVAVTQFERDKNEVSECICKGLLNGSGDTWIPRWIWKQCQDPKELVQSPSAKRRRHPWLRPDKSKQIQQSN
jgi:hypothetical protein